MAEITTGVNWLAVLAGTIVSFLLGWLWYSPKLFGKKWAEGAKVSLAEGSSMPVGALLTQLGATFLLAWVVGVTAVHSALSTMILVTVTIAVLMISGGMFSQKSHYTIATEAGFVIAMVVIMIVCQGVLS